MPPRSLPRLVVMCGLMTMLTVTMFLASSRVSTGALSSVPSIRSYLDSQIRFSANDGCRGWDPHGPPSQDPPNCLRARQLRQLQVVLAEGEPVFDDAAWSMMYHAERCIMGVVKCPERPIIFTDYWYFWTYEHSASGEGIWGDPIIATLVDMNYASVRVNFHWGREVMWNITRKLSESIDAYWTDEETVMECLLDPRCVRPEDYVPAENPKYRFNLDKIPQEQLGRMPAWRIHATTFWGARPKGDCGNGDQSGEWYGLENVPGEPIFSYHTLGNKWHIVPYSYPGHTHIPISIERTCLSSPTTPYDQRDDAVIILAKQSRYFHGYSINNLRIDVWDTVLPAMKDLGFSFWTVAQDENNKDLVPEGIVQFPQMTRAAYGKMVSSAKAMLAIGQPMISPSPYTSLCRGVPVLIPYWGEKPTGMDDWRTYGPRWSQHGPALWLGEPWVYGYNISDPEDLIRQLKKAISTPIKPYVPPEMSLRAVRQRVAEVVQYDWEGEYKRIVKENGGMPTFPKIVVEMLHERMKTDYRVWALVQ